jgi:short-subunit dehydrogenase
MNKAIIIGATGGIGEALARELVRQGYAVGLTGRRVERLAALKQELGANAFIKPLDLTRPDEAMAAIKQLIDEMGGLDVLVLNSGVGYMMKDLKWEFDRSTIEVNVSGFVAALHVGLDYFVARGSGHIVGISSVAALVGGGGAPAYNASKAFVSNYMSGLRQRLHMMGLLGRITVTDVRPGFVDTDLVRENKTMFWVATPAKAAQQIAAAIRRKRRIVYITRRWCLIAWLSRIVPGALYEKMRGR